MNISFYGSLIPHISRMCMYNVCKHLTLCFNLYRITNVPNKITSRHKIAPTGPITQTNCFKLSRIPKILSIRFFSFIIISPMNCIYVLKPLFLKIHKPKLVTRISVYVDALPCSLSTVHINCPWDVTGTDRRDNVWLSFNNSYSNAEGQFSIVSFC